MTFANPDDPTPVDTTTTPIRLADAERCPVSPKLMCEGANCQGRRYHCDTQFSCSDERLFPSSDGRSLILAGCRYCPLPIHVVCNSVVCAVPEDTRVCVAEPLQGRACWTWGNRLESMKASIAEHRWESDGSNGINFEPTSSDDEDGAAVFNSSSRLTAIMHHWGLLQDRWAMDVTEKLY